MRHSLRRRYGPLRSSSFVVLAFLAAFFKGYYFQKVAFSVKKVDYARQRTFLYSSILAGVPAVALRIVALSAKNCAKWVLTLVIARR